MCVSVGVDVCTCQCVCVGVCGGVASDNCCWTEEPMFLWVVIVRVSLTLCKSVLCWVRQQSSFHSVLPFHSSREQNDHCGKCTKLLDCGWTAGFHLFCPALPEKRMNITGNVNLGLLAVTQQCYLQCVCGNTTVLPLVCLWSHNSATFCVSVVTQQ